MPSATNCPPPPPTLRMAVYAPALVWCRLIYNQVYRVMNHTSNENFVQFDNNKKRHILELQDIDEVYIDVSCGSKILDGV